MKKLYEKSEILFSLLWIIIYCVLMSVGDNLSATVGINDSVTLPIGVILSLVVLLLLKNNGLFVKYGLCKPKASASEMLYYIPLIILLTANLFCGVTMNYTPFEAILFIIKMFCVGLLEEIIFRGLLFKALLKNGVKSAVIISSVTFGAGHIINLINGSGAELFENILQIIYAIAVGFMFVMIYYKSGSLISCIITHGLFNALSAFSDETALTTEKRIFSCIFLVAVSGAYALYIALIIKKKNSTTA